MNDLIDTILEEINGQSRATEESLVAFANEMAVGVTAEREAEIAEALPRPYTMLESSTADVDGEKIRVPRMVLATASKVADGDWITSTSGRRMKLPKADCAVGVHTVVDSEYAKVLRVVVLWRRDKS